MVGGAIPPVEPRPPSRKPALVPLPAGYSKANQLLEAALLAAQERKEEEEEEEEEHARLREASKAFDAGRQVERAAMKAALAAGLATGLRPRAPCKLPPIDDRMMRPRPFGRW